MLRRAFILFAVLVTGACGTLGITRRQQAALPPDHYVVFFSPRTAQLADDAQMIVRQAALAVRQRKPSKIEIAVPPAVPGGANVVEGRYTAIQNMISAAGGDPSVYARVVLSSDAQRLPGGNDRAEIRLLK